MNFTSNPLEREMKRRPRPRAPRPEKPREAVLPLNPALEAALTDGPAPGLRPCAVCGRLFAPEGKRAFYSAACAENARRKRQRGYMRKRRLDC